MQAGGMVLAAFYAICRLCLSGQGWFDAYLARDRSEQGHLKSLLRVSQAPDIECVYQEGS